MKTIYKNHFKKILPFKIEKELEGFHKFGLRLTKEQRAKAWLSSDAICFQKNVNNQQTYFVNVLPDSKQDQFDIELGWSSNRQYPWQFDKLRMTIKNDRSELNMPECLMLYGELYRWSKNPATAHTGWYIWQCSVPCTDPSYLESFVIESSKPVSEEVAEHRVTIAVDKFINDVKTVVLPFFEEHERTRMGTPPVIV